MQTQATRAPSLYELGRDAWPDVDLDEATFVRRLSHLDIPLDQVAARAGDLYLAWACAEGNPVALAHFDQHHLRRIGIYVARWGLSDDTVDELRQQLRIRLLVGECPRIGQYGG